MAFYEVQQHRLKNVLDSHSDLLLCECFKQKFVLFVLILN